MTEGTAIPVATPSGGNLGNAPGSTASPSSSSPVPSQPSSGAPPSVSTPSGAPSGLQTSTPPGGSSADPTPPAPSGSSTEPHPSSSQPPSAEFKVPEQYKDKGWAAKVKSLDDLYQQIDTLDALKGKKSVAPDLATATPEERDAFYASMRPKDASEYKFVGEMQNPVAQEAVGKLFMDNGISATQGNAVIEGYTKVMETEQAKMFDPEGFKSAMKGTFGDGWEGVRDGIHQNLGKLMTPEDYKLMSENLPNAYVNLIYKTLGNTQKAVDNMMKRYGVKETNLAHFAEQTTSTGGGDMTATRANLRAEMTKMRAGPHTAAQYNELQQRLAKTYENDPRATQG